MWTMEAWLVMFQKEAKTIRAVHVRDWKRICAFLGQWMWASWDWKKKNSHS